MLLFDFSVVDLFAFSCRNIDRRGDFLCVKFFFFQIWQLNLWTNEKKKFFWLFLIGVDLIGKSKLIELFCLKKKNLNKLTSDWSDLCLTGSNVNEVINYFPFNSFFFSPLFQTWLLK